MAQAEVWTHEEERVKAKAVELASQVPKCKISWEEIGMLQPFHISFLLPFVYDALPSISHLHTWRLELTWCKKKEDHHPYRRGSRAFLTRMAEAQSAAS